MKAKTFFKGIVATIAIATTLVMLGAGESNAALQANKNTQYKNRYTPENWMTYFRQMEISGGAMGLNETLNTDLTASSESNNVDVHMMRATEYGAIAILSASGYGNPSNANAITTTTGNNSGIILNTRYWENVAGGYAGIIFTGVNQRYFDTYTSNKSITKIGDAFGTASTSNPGATGWHSATKSVWVLETTVSYNKYFYRGLGGIFSYDRINERSSGGSYTDAFCRGVVVNGTGL